MRSQSSFVTRFARIHYFVMPHPRACRMFALLLGWAVLAQPRIGLAQATGFFPIASLTRGADGNFYGTTQDGGAYDDGSLFRITPQGSLTILYSFSALDQHINSDGA